MQCTGVICAIVLIFGGCVLVDRKKVVPLHPGKSYTTSSPRTPPGLDRSNGIGS